jgi:hypothetical protein
MTDERQQDEKVSLAYRDLAGERTPAHLDEKVMRMAANQAEHPRYSQSIRWTRPLAWAATIALCLAITLEVTRTPTPEAIAVLPASNMPEQKLSVPADASLPQKTELAKAPAAAAEQEDVVRSRRKQAADQPQREVQEREIQEREIHDRFNAELREDDAIEEVLAAPAMEFRAADTAMLQRAEEIAAMASGTSAALSPCSDEARNTPESWLKCIEGLELSGETAAAALERESLIEVFPDFPLP